MLLFLFHHTPAAVSAACAALLPAAGTRPVSRVAAGADCGSASSGILVRHALHASDFAAHASHKGNSEHSCNLRNRHSAGHRRPLYAAGSSRHLDGLHPF